MRKLTCTVVLSLLSSSIVGTAMAQTNNPSEIQQLSSIQPVAFQSDADGLALADAGSGGAAVVSPSSTAAKAEAEKPKEEEKKEEEKPANAPPEGPYEIFHNLGDFGAWEDCHHLDLRGYFNVGAALNPAEPHNQYNGPVGYDDTNVLQLNQLYLTAERLTKVRTTAARTTAIASTCSTAATAASCRPCPAAAGTTTSATATASTAWPSRRRTCSTRSTS